MILIIYCSASKSLVFVDYPTKNKDAVSSCYQELATKAKEERLFPKAKSKKKRQI